MFRVFVVVVVADVSNWVYRSSLSLYQVSVIVFSRGVGVFGGLSESFVELSESFPREPNVRDERRYGGGLLRLARF